MVVGSLMSKHMVSTVSISIQKSDEVLRFPPTGPAVTSHTEERILLGELLLVGHPATGNASRKRR